MNNLPAASFLLFSVLMGSLPSLGAQDLVDPVVEEEAPEALFDQKIGDIGVVLEAEGTWTTRLAGGWGSGFSPQGVLPGLGYPGFERMVVFTQEPDFALTLRLVERYYLELTYRGSLEDRSFLLGYDGQPGELVQWLKAGNAAFSVPKRAGEQLPDGRRGAPAVGGAFEAGPVTFELLGRYESGVRETRSFRGYQDQARSVVALDAWMRDRFYRIPGPYPLVGVQVLVADPLGAQGSGSYRYRAAASNEAVVDSSTGEIRLERQADRRFLVTWSNAGSYSGASATAQLGVKAVPSTEIGSGTWFVLSQPGSPSFFEVRNRYPIERGTNQPVLLIESSSNRLVAGYSLGQSPLQDWFEVTGSGEEAPFQAVAPGIYPTSLPGTPPPAGKVLPYFFRLPSLGVATSFELGTEIEKTSLIVVRNGLPTTAYQFDDNSGKLTLDTPVYDTDSIEVSYQSKKVGTKASDLVLWNGGKWSVASGQELEWNLQGRWNMDKSSFTTEDLQSPGRMAATVAWSGRENQWTWSLSATGGALLADSTGHRRLYGQDAGVTSATYDGNSLRPSATPSGSALTLSPNNRAPTRFRNYWTSDPLTGSPQVSAYGKPGINPEPWTEGGLMGPYLVRGDDVRSDRLAVVEADFPASSSWAGLQVALDQGKARDLRTATEITLLVRLVGGQGGDTVFFQAGTLSEDYDGTGAVRSVEYLSQPGLTFSDQGVRRVFPIPDDSNWGNDADGDGTASQDGELVTRDLSTGGLGFNPVSTGWQAITIRLTADERQALARVTGSRLILSNPSPTAGTRTLLVGPIVYEGSNWSVVADAAAGAGSQVVPVESEDPTRAGGHQLRVTWVNRQDWSVEGRHAPVRPASYRTIAFRFRNEVIPGASTFSLLLSNAEARGLKASWPAAAASGWIEGRIDLKTKTLTFDGVAVPGSTVTIDSDAPQWDRMRLSKSSGASDAGSWILAEVEAVDPLWEPVGSTFAALGWRQSEPWPSAEVPVLTGMKVDVVSRQSGLSNEELSWSGLSSVNGNLGPLRASSEVTFLKSARELQGHGSYEAVLPLAFPGGTSLELADRFSGRGLRSERILLGLPWVGSWEAFVRADGAPISLNQEYRLSWSSPSPWSPLLSGAWSSQWNQTRPTTAQLNSFGQQWLESWNWLVPQQSVAPFYLLQSKGSFNLKPDPIWALEGRASARVSQSLSQTLKWSPGGNWELRLPLTFGAPASSWSLTPSVSKSVESVEALLDPLPPLSSAAQTLQDLLAQPGGLGALPFLEGFESNPWPKTQVQSATIESQFALDWQRTPTSESQDLYLPVSGNAKVTGIRGREGSGEYRSQSLSVALLTQAKNLFGALGSQPIAPWYRTDVFSWAATGLWKTGTRTTDESVDASLSARTDLILSTAESLSLPVTFQGNWSVVSQQSLGMKPSWSLKSPANLPFELPRWLSPRLFKRQWVQELGTSFSWGWQPTPAPVLQDLQVTWKGRLLISEKGELSLSTRWGQQWKNNLTVVGLDAALDLILSF